MPAYGRFAEPDPAHDQGLENPQSWDLYGYVDNNPVTGIDPNGMEGGWLEKLGNLALGGKFETNAQQDARYQAAAIAQEQAHPSAITMQLHESYQFFKRNGIPLPAGETDPLPNGSTESGFQFPMHKRPAASYKNGGRQFGAGRDGRLHAACDLLASPGTEVLAMRDGTITRGVSSFYNGTYSLEVTFDNGMVGRYGEIGGSIPDGLRLGSAVHQGDTIGHLIANSKDNKSMLHLEMYSGAATGNLTQVGNGRYSRRSDLIDPTSILDRAIVK